MDIWGKFLRKRKQWERTFHRCYPGFDHLDFGSYCLIGWLEKQKNQSRTFKQQSIDYLRQVTKYNKQDIDRFGKIKFCLVKTALNIPSMDTPLDLLIQKQEEGIRIDLKRDLDTLHRNRSPRRIDTDINEPLPDLSVVGLTEYNRAYQRRRRSIERSEAAIVEFRASLKKCVFLTFES